MNKNKIDKLNRLTETAGLILVMYYVCNLFYDASRFHFTFSGISRIFTVAAPMALVGGMRFAILALEEWHNNRKLLIIKTIAILLSAVPCLYLAYRFDYVFFVYLICAALCLYRTDTDKVLKVFIVVLGLLLVAVVLCSVTGAVPNLISVSIGESHHGNLRNAYGVASSTDFAAYFVFWLSFFWCSRDSKRDKWNLIFTLTMVLAAIGCIYYFTSTWTSMFLCVMLFLLILYESFEERILQKNGKFIRVQKLLDLFVTIAFPLLGAVFGILTWLYGKGSTLAVGLDQLIDARLKYAWLSYLKYGIHLLGSLTPQHGWGGNIIKSWQGDYDFLDGGYGLLFIRYGVLITIIITAVWVWMTARALKKGRRRLAFVMALIAVHCFEEHHFPELNYNILLAMPLCMLASSGGSDAGGNDDPKTEPYPWLGWAAGAAVLFISGLLLPAFISRSRSVFAVSGWLGGGNRSLFAMLLFLLVLIMLLVLWNTVVSLLRIRLIKKTVRSKHLALTIAGIVLPVLIILGVSIWMEYTIQNGTRLYEERMSSDAEAVKLIVEAAEQPVYVDQIGELYRRRFDGLSETYDSPETISERMYGTMVVEKTFESYILTNTGAVYAEISPYSSIYTYDKAVISALQSAGYNVRGYYYTEKEVKLSKKKSRVSDAFVNRTNLYLYGARYQTTFDITVDEEALKTIEGEVCTLEVTTYWGNNVILRKELGGSRFDETGHAIEELRFTIGNCAGVEFNIYTNIPLTINHIYYRKSPESDIWRTYDQYNRLIEERFFAGDETPQIQQDGSYGYSYEYKSGREGWTWYLRKCLDETGSVMMNKNGYAQMERVLSDDELLLEIRYLDVAGNLCCSSNNAAIERYQYDDRGRAIIYKYYGVNEEPVRTVHGYAELHREYNEEGQRIKDEYYDESGEPLSMSGGQLAEEYEYDEMGNIKTIRYLGRDNAPLLLSSGYAEVHRLFNGLKQIVEDSYYDTDGELVLIPQGYAIAEYRYDEAGNRNYEKYYGVDHEPVRNASGYGEIHRTFEGNRIVKNEFYDTDGEPLALDAGQYGVSYGYDENGNINRYTYLDQNGNPMMGTDGYCEQRKVFNELQQVIVESYYDTNEVPVLLPKGYAMVEYEYDEKGNINRYVYLGPDGSAIMRTDGFAELRREFNERNQMIRQECYDDTGKPVICEYGYFICDYVYNDDGVLTEERHYDTNGSLIDTIAQ